MLTRDQAQGKHGALRGHEPANIALPLNINFWRFQIGAACYQGCLTELSALC